MDMCAPKSLIFLTWGHLLLSNSLHQLVHLSLDHAPELIHPLFSRGLKSEDQGRLGVGGSQQSPAVGERDPHAVNVNDLISLTEVLCSPLHDLELDVIRTIDPDLRCDIGLGNPFQKLCPLLAALPH